MSESMRGSHAFRGIATALPVVLLAMAIVPMGGFACTAPDCNGGYSGRAYGVWVHTPVSDHTFADTGWLPPEGGVLTGTLESVNVGVAAGEVLESWTSGGGGVAESAAAVGDVSLSVGGVVTVSADFVRAHTRATCDDGAHGSSEISGLMVNGVPITVTGDVGQMVYVPGVFTLIINEQGTINTDSCKSIIVNALHLWVQGVEIVVASAHSDITCPITQGGGGGGEQTKDFVTGGGWIWRNGYHANFGFVAGYKPNQDLRGELNFIDHADGMHVKATSVDTYHDEFANPKAREFTGHATINGGGDYTYICYVEDNQEPGRGYDYFRLTLSTGYVAEEYLAGGNIQLHK
ncbi:MAG: hypothetical protein E6K18_07345 [Methanobacteriota archaeon]|nr:MAG: hypothetical protein E6K18_07345 [Euryarchaeota archaeon]